MNFYQSHKEKFRTVILEIIIAVCIVFNSNEIISQKKLMSSYTEDLNWENPEWENPEIFEINREEPSNFL